MEQLEQLKLDAIKKATLDKGRKLTGLEALEVERRTEEKFAETHPEYKKTKGNKDKLPLSQYRFD